MKRIVNLLLMASLAGIPFADASAQAAKTGANPKVRITTNFGTIELELDAKRAPITVKNFLEYVAAKHYDGVIFHRVILGFMIQGGGFTPGMKQKSTRAPIQNEADNGLKNLAGTIAMARTSDPHSASAQFFINTVNNPNLDHQNKSMRGWGYAVFGKVTKGLDVVKKIEATATGSVGPLQNVPVKDVVIKKVGVVKK